MNAASLQAAWLAFRETSNAPPSAEGHFKAALLSCEPPEVRPYVHGDPRVDRWQVEPGGTSTLGGRLEPLEGTPSNFEPLAAWTFLPAIECWERPLRRVAKEPDR